MKKLFFSVSALLSGMLNGFFGTGGGVALWFASAKQGNEKQAFATSSVGVLILSLFSAFLYGQTATPFSRITPLFVLLAVLGGAVGATLLGRLPTRSLRLLFAFLLIGSGAYAIWKGVSHAFPS